MSDRKLNMFTLAFGIALLPPLWAVLAPYIGITTGAVALICAGLYVTNGNKIKDAFKISIGFLCGDAWAVLAVFLMEVMNFNPAAELFLTLFVLGAIAVLIGESLPKFIFTPAWLCGWAIGLTIMGPMTTTNIWQQLMPLQIGGAMLVGVFYVGICVDAFQKLLIKGIKKIKNKEND